MRGQGVLLHLDPALDVVADPVAVCQVTKITVTEERHCMVILRYYVNSVLRFHWAMCINSLYPKINSKYNKMSDFCSLTRRFVFTN